MNNEIFVKLNYKNIGELKSFVYDPLVEIEIMISM